MIWLKRHYLAGGTALLTCWLIASPVYAQTVTGSDPHREKSGAVITTEVAPTAVDSSQTDAQRMDKSYQPQGMDAGQFLFFPKLEVGQSLNNNIYAKEQDNHSDLITNPEMSALLRSRFARHQLNLRMVASDYIFRKYEQENHLDVSTDAEGKLDLGENSEITGFAQYALGHEDRSSPDDVGGKEPTETDSYRVKLAGKHQVGKFMVGTEEWFRRLEFSNVQATNNSLLINSHRNRREYEERLRGGYEMFPGYAAVVEFGMNQRQYDTANTDGVLRNSTGFDVMTGVGVDISDLIRGDLLVGYLQQNYDSSTLRSPSGLAFRANLN